MNREIEFRGLLEGKLGWAYGCLVFMAGNEKNTHILSKDGSLSYVIPESVGQYTGVDDFNGNKLYEGDKVAWVDSDGVDREDVIEWVNGGLVLCNGNYTVGSYIGKKLKKVGNIHEGGVK